MYGLSRWYGVKKPWTKYYSRYIYVNNNIVIGKGKKYVTLPRRNLHVIAKYI